MSAIEKAMQKLQKQTSVTQAKQTISAKNSEVAAAFVSEQAASYMITDAVKPVISKRQSRLVKIDLPALTRQGFISNEAMRTPLNEQFRQIKRPLLRNAFDDEGEPLDNQNLVVLTSCLAGEGKTFCALNLALSIAKEKERTVLLIDSDAQRQSLSNLLGLQDQKGLLDFLDDTNLQLADVLIKTDIKNLAFIPAGSYTAQTTELLASDRMQHLANELAERYPDRLIIIDAPPLQATSEASVLVSLAGQVLLVVAAASTPQQLLLNAIKQIPKEKQVGLILNKQLQMTEHDYRGGYYGH